MRADRLTDLADWALELVDTTPVAHLGLIDEKGFPRVQPITFARVDDQLWTAIDDKPKRRTPKRIERLRSNPRATITVDRYDDDWSRLAWVQAVGRVDVLPLEDRIVDALQRRYPTYRTLSPKGPLLRLTPDFVLGWRASG
jgi:PPOX class probable F420-dependent enzyme